MQRKLSLKLEEHYILKNIKTFAIHYLVLWCVALCLGIAVSALLTTECDPTITKTFGVSVVTLSITTITFALPTCMRTIFAAYENYHSSTIRTILMERFPITLLSLSAFTSLLVSLLVASGIIGLYWQLPGWGVLTVMLFWALVCVFYLFCAIEKLVHFVVRAPDAVLDKLEFNIYEVRALDSDEEYAEFRQNLASMSDVAATIVRNSTGKDATISDYLERLREIHRVYAGKCVNSDDKDVRHRHRKACYACGKELTKLYREAASNNNGDMTRTILKSYCLIIRDAIVLGCSRNYLAELIAQIGRFQSYSLTARAPEIYEQATVHWFFLMLRTLKDVETEHVDRVWHVKHCIVREMLTTLRRITLRKDEDTLDTFLRLASNSDLDIDLDIRSNEWLGLLDRTVLLYLNWLIKTNPVGAEECLALLRRHSLRQGMTMRPLFCDTIPRFKELLKLERFDSHLSVKSADFEKKAVGTAALMDLPLDIDATRFLCYLVEMTYLDVSDDEIFREVPRLGKLCDEVPSTLRDTAEFEQSLRLANLACHEPNDLDRRFFATSH